MPTYVYRREDGSTFEVEQRITENPLEVCPETGQKVERVITGAGLIFKGSGFYLTDYARKNGSTNSDSGETKPSTDSSTATKSTESSEKAGSSNGTATSSSKKAE